MMLVGDSLAPFAGPRIVFSMGRAWLPYPRERITVAWDLGSAARPLEEPAAGLGDCLVNL
jgi:hypothetical protein